MIVFLKKQLPLSSANANNFFYKLNIPTMKKKSNLKMMAKSLNSFSAMAIFLLMVSSCGNSNSANKQENADKAVDSAKTSTKDADKNANSETVKTTNESGSGLTEVASTASEKTVVLTLKETLSKAKKDGNSVFVVVTGTGDKDIDKALEIAGKANKSVKKSIVVKMDRDDKNNAALVTEYGVSSAPLPLILVVSPSGVQAGGYLLVDATADNLVKLIPSTKQDDVLMALNNKKSVFIVASKNTFTDKAKAIENCKTAVTLNGNKSILVEVDLSDTKEKSFLELLKVNTATTSTATIIINIKGQINGTFYELKDAATLVTLANKVASSCCGGGKSCGK
jgi:hypothetical protein